MSSAKYLLYECTYTRKRDEAPNVRLPRPSGLSGLGGACTNLLECASFGLRDESSDENKPGQADDAIAEKDARCSLKLHQKGKGVGEKERGYPQGTYGRGDALGGDGAREYLGDQDPCDGRQGKGIAGNRTQGK